MIRALVQLYLASDTRLAYLKKDVEFVAMPRVGEWLKLKNEEMGDYFGFEVIEVTHRESQGPEIMLGLLKADEKDYDLFEDEAELDEYVSSYIDEGWELVSLKENKLYRNTKI